MLTKEKSPSKAKTSLGGDSGDCLNIFYSKRSRVSAGLNNRVSLGGTPLHHEPQRHPSDNPSPTTTLQNLWLFNSNNNNLIIIFIISFNNPLNTSIEI